ncbi:MAG: ribosomal RNA small subunit methyltransferase A [Sphingomonadales bacterium]|nr:ribosomal RNA small subunit methyltransferase A [Sphingomonadales bacterium]
MERVRPKKQLGQHFLTDGHLAEKVALSLTGWGNYTNLLEIGPGTGQLTRHLLHLPYRLWLAEVDQDSIQYLLAHQLAEPEQMVGDFLRWNPQPCPDMTALAKHQGYHHPVDNAMANQACWGVVGNFPYHISTEIIFKVLEHHEQVGECVGMFQREVAQRICSPHGSKVYGITSVLTQAFFEAEYLFTVNEGAFFPPPKVKSGVLRLKNLWNPPACDHRLLFRVVKAAFNQRRKMLSNALSQVLPDGYEDRMKILHLRAEQLPVHAFIELTQAIQEIILIENSIPNQP